LNLSNLLTAITPETEGVKKAGKKAGGSVDDVKKGKNGTVRGRTWWSQSGN